jgi:antitoxin (DNA-binding transcriptional repressor) of toxin-antitoxin stability system
LRFSERVDKALLGKKIIIARDNKPLLRFVPVATATRRMPSTAKHEVLFIVEGFDAPLPDFTDYT